MMIYDFTQAKEMEKRSEEEKILKYVCLNNNNTHMNCWQCGWWYDNENNILWSIW